MQGPPAFAIIAVVMALVMVVLLFAVLRLPPSPLSRFFCWLRGGHLYEEHGVNFDRIWHEAAEVTRQTQSCQRTSCTEQQDVPIEQLAL